MNTQTRQSTIGKLFSCTLRIFDKYLIPLHYKLLGGWVLFMSGLRCCLGGIGLAGCFCGFEVVVVARRISLS